MSGAFENSNDPHRYDDIIGLPHYVSGTRAHMPLIDRAAQFAPFAALTGYGEAIDETARLTDERSELDENEKLMLDARLQLVREHIKDHPEISLCYFLPDTKKAGGAYVNIFGKLKKINEFERLLIMEDGTLIPIDDIYSIGGAFFETAKE